MMRETFNKLFFSRLLNDVSSYFRAYDYLKVKAIALTQGVITIKDEKDFWSKILGDSFYLKIDDKKLENGAILSFENFFLTDWAPKLPGGIWTKKGNEKAFGVRDELDYLKVGKEIYPIVHPDSKMRKINAGFGSIRVNPSGNGEDYYNYMCLTGPEYWNCDLGIPVIVHKSVYEEYLKLSQKGAPWVEKLEGILILNENLPLQKFISSSIGYNLSEEVSNELSNMPHLPKCYVYIPSRLNINMKSNDSHPSTTAWTMFETNRDDYGLTYCQFNPYEKNAFEGVTEFLENYAMQFGGQRLVTDFDGITPRLNAKVNLSKDPMVTSKEEFEKFIKKVESKL